ncbi:putative bifunctional diguanylate cyclase/phosphodiesterase [Pseudoalteromonas denitrificans]|nr:EAL domain-containing protein [Pseudoalteromonas denitrificans]
MAYYFNVLFDNSQVFSSSFILNELSFIIILLIFGSVFLCHMLTLLVRNNKISDMLVQKTQCLIESNLALKEESKLKESALKQQQKSKNQYEKLFFNSPEGLFTLDSCAVITRFNPAFSSLLLDQTHNIHDLSLSDFIYSQEHIDTWQLDVIARKNYKEYEWLAKNQSGKSIWLRQSGHWIKNESVWTYEGQIVDITQSKLLREQLKYKTKHDGLTNLLNRDAFFKKINNLKGLNKGHYILLYIDLDRFKLINDTLGHVAGDKVLIEFAARMQFMLGSFSDIARLGGDEFAILMSEKSLNGNEIDLLINILREIQKTFKYLEHHINVTGSMGVRKFKTTCCNYDAEKLLHDADIAMQEAKRQGKNDFFIFSNQLTKKIKRKLHIETLLRELDPDLELSINFQPLYCKFDQNLIGFEALLRWDNDILGRINPDEFISIAEECGKITMLGKWVFDHALIFLEQQEAQSKNLFININVSPMQLQQTRFMSWLAKRVTNSALSINQIRIELTESAMIAKEETLIPHLNTIHELGIGIYIDDFGTGYSSLARIKKLPIDGIKIDRAFIENIETDNGAIQLVKAICAIAEAFNLSVTAEGIETQQQLNVLRHFYCHQFQGYFFSKPLTELQAINLIQSELGNLPKRA